MSWYLPLGRTTVLPSLVVSTVLLSIISVLPGSTGELSAEGVGLGVFFVFLLSFLLSISSGVGVS